MVINKKGLKSWFYQVASAFFFVESIYCNHDEVGDDVHNQGTRGPNQNGINSQFGPSFDNPYYEGGLDGITPSNDRQGKNPTSPDLNDTGIGTATHNVYCDL